MSDKEKVSGEEVEVFYECREIGEGDWTPCDLRRYTYCQKQPEMDTRAFVPLYQHTRIVDQLRAEVERKQREIDLLWSDRRKDAALIAELRAQLAQQQGVLDGFVLVPVEPTLEMANASVYNGTDYTGSFDFDDFKKDWTDILAAAPAPELGK